ncbi:MAG: hypothetical protein ACLFRX_03175, partial [Gemmatimonadota bacterium]
MTALLLALLLWAPQGPLEVTMVRPPQGPTVLLHRQAGPLVALRMSAPVEPGLPEGSAELLQELARARATLAAEQVGARLSLRREPGTAVLAVTGPASAFDALAALLRDAVRPDLDVATLRRARARAEDRVLAELEQPGPRVERLLWHELHGASEPPRGAAAALLSPEDIRHIARRMYHPDRVRITVVGDIPQAAARSAFAGWPVAGPVP